MSYEIGYRKPPVHSRFRKGQSGNPGGRPGAWRLRSGSVQAELEELLLLSPEEFASSVPRNDFGDVAADLAREAVGGKAAAVRRLFYFASERGVKRPRRARLPVRIKSKLDRAMSQGNSQAIAEKRQSQGITPAQRAPDSVAAKASRGGAENAHAGAAAGTARPCAISGNYVARGSASAHLREFTGGETAVCSHRATEGTELRCRSAVYILREMHDIRGSPPNVGSSGNTLREFRLGGAVVPARLRGAEAFVSAKASTGHVQHSSSAEAPCSGSAKVVIHEHEFSGGFVRNAGTRPAMTCLFVHDAFSDRLREAG